MSVELSFRQVSRVNGQRCDRWHSGYSEAWKGSDWSNAMCGEAGETANVVKKLRRIETGLPGAADPPPDVLRKQLADEIADTYLYLDLLAQFYGIDIASAVANKFNRVSEREGFPERIAIE